MKIWGIRQGMIGDSIMSLPVLNFLEKNTQDLTNSLLLAKNLVNQRHYISIIRLLIKYTY